MITEHPSSGYSIILHDDVGNVLVTSHLEFERFANETGVGIRNTVTFEYKATQDVVVGHVDVCHDGQLVYGDVLDCKIELMETDTGTIMPGDISLIMDVSAYELAKHLLKTDQFWDNYESKIALPTSVL
jgi:hypothetical protein